jgi:hypothetical protein
MDLKNTSFVQFSLLSYPIETSQHLNLNLITAIGLQILNMFHSLCGKVRKDNPSL